MGIYGFGFSVRVVTLVTLAALTVAPVRAGAGCASHCGGDCDGNASVTVDEITRAIELALSGGVSGCAAADINGDTRITVDEILRIVNTALTGCFAPSTPPYCGDGIIDGCSDEECDDGGFCAGGEQAGKPCTAESDCAGIVGACIGGPNDLRGCTSHASCPNGECRKCRPAGGDGCAQNCTTETDLKYVFEPAGDEGLLGGSGSGFVWEGAIVQRLLLPIEGSQVLTVGKPRSGRPIPVAVKASSVSIKRIPVYSIACACVRSAAARTCGGILFHEDGSAALNCTPEFENPMTCPRDRPCAYVHGPGNTASGFIDCAPRAQEYDLTAKQDCNGAPGEPPFPPWVLVAPGELGAGSALISTSMAFGTVVGQCTGTAPDYGPDGKFCTADDDPSTFGSPNGITLTTGSATTYVDGIIYEDEGEPTPPVITGTRFQCGTKGVTTTEGAALVGGSILCDQPTIADVAAAVRLEAAGEP